MLCSVLLHHDIRQYEPGAASQENVHKNVLSSSFCNTFPAETGCMGGALEVPKGKHNASGEKGVVGGSNAVSSEWECLLTVMDNRLQKCDLLYHYFKCEMCYKNSN